MKVVRYQVSGMDCADCATKIERAARGVSGVEGVRVSIASQVMTLTVGDASVHLPDVERAVTSLGYQLDRIKATRPAETGETDGDEWPAHVSTITSSYTRALWVVVLLNVGYGLVESVAGFLSGSQALKADALDFIGDGFITLLALLASGRRLRWRARSALIQGLFLGALGVAVLVNTAYRTFVLRQPEAELMGLFGTIALAVNVTAALVLIPHRTGDASARAVWLFSRNDALGNLAVVVAAGLVAWSGTPWPDLAVAMLIAGLFLHSSMSIIQDARRDLRGAS